MDCVENMFYVSNEENKRFVPWHGLGEPVEKALSSAEAIKMAGLDWEVLSEPIYDSYGNIINGYKRNVRSSDNTTLGVVTNKYKIVQNQDAFNFTDSLLDEGVTYETAGSLKNGRTIWLLAKMPERKILDDKFEPYICFTNTHDGTGAIKVACTPIRVVCNNTLNLALKSSSRSWSARHMGDIHSKLSEAKITLGLANSYLDNLAVEAERLVNVKMTDLDFECIFDSLYPIDRLNDTERKIRNVIEMKENLFKCVLANDLRIYNGTAWLYINAVTDYVAHTMPARLTANYQENNWGRIMHGHPMVDAIYKKL